MAAHGIQEAAAIWHCQPQIDTLPRHSPEDIAAISDFIRDLYF
jgi:hypothetical protein